MLHTVVGVVILPLLIQIYLKLLEFKGIFRKYGLAFLLSYSVQGV